MKTLWNKNAKFSGYFFYINTNIWGDFQICISVPLVTLKITQKKSPQKLCKKVVLKNFAIFTGKHLGWRLFLIQNIAKFFRASILKKTSANGCFWKCSWNWEKLKDVDRGFYLYIKKTRFFNINVRNKWKCISLCFYFMIGFLWILYLHKYFFDVVRNKLHTTNIYTRVDKKKIKRSRKGCVIRTCFKFWPMKNIFQKLKANESLIMTCLQIYR